LGTTKTSMVSAAPVVSTPNQPHATSPPPPTEGESLEPVNDLPPLPPLDPPMPPKNTAPPWFESAPEPAHTSKITAVRASSVPPPPPASPAPTENLPPLPPVQPPPSVSPGHHTFLGSTAQPLAAPNDQAQTGQPDWSGPFGLTPSDPMANKTATTSEFGSAPVGADPEKAQSNFGQGHAISPPGQNGLTPPTPAPAVDNARSAVEHAFAAAPFNPDDTPVQALNAQPLGREPIVHEAPMAQMNVPPMKNSDTPMLVLPTGNASPPASMPPANPSVSGVAPPAPPPVPPPLMAAPGAVVPTPPPQQ
jgi:hypothetical protein